ncbi:hypothetical protein ACQPZJ_44850 [Actinoplanes sp. CA-054009]
MTYDVLTRAHRAKRRRLIRTVLLIVSVVILVVGGFLMAADLSSHDDRSPDLVGPSLPGGDAAPSSTASGGRRDAGSAAALPADLTWNQIAGVSIPVSAQAGPHTSSSGLAYGFTRDRAGAVLAAVNLVVRVTPQVGPAVFDATLRAQVVGPYAAALREQLNQQYQQLCTQAGVASGPPVGRLPAALRGYRIDLYNDTTVLMRVMTEADRPGAAPLYAAAVVQLAWTGDDWALVAPTGGVWDQSITEVAAANVGTYHPFTSGR